MDPNEPKPVIKLPISIEYDSFRHDTSMLTDSTTATLHFVSQDFWVQNGLMGNCARGPKTATRIANY